MAHLIAADGHFIGAPLEAERFAALVQARPVEEISLLGDLFELWLGLEGLEAAWQAQIFAPLIALKERGVRLRYVVGNKDFFVEEWNARHGLFDEVAAVRSEVQSPLGRLVLEHGDLVNSADRQYRAWRAFSRSLPMRLLARSLPRAMLSRLALRLAERLKTTNVYHKSYFPEAALRARARELGQGPATIIYGHFHVHKEITEGDKRVVTLPFLGGEMAGLLVTPEGLLRVGA